ncbi:MAG: tetratricopeptide repeat protein [Bacteroidota bacterium]
MARKSFKEKLTHPKAQRRFTDRETQQKAFWNTLQRHREANFAKHHILMYYGVGGIGKSRLQTHLIEQLEKKTEDKASQDDYLIARLDFDEENLALSPLQTLDELRFQMRRDYSVSFNTYDIAYLIYWKTANPRIKLEVQAPKVFANSDIPMDVLKVIEEHEVAKDIIKDIAETALDWTTLGLVSKVGKLLEKNIPKIQRWWQERGNEELKALSRMEKPSEIAGALPYFLALDIQAYLQTHPDRQAIFFLDTYEKLIGDRRSEKEWRNYDDWVRTLISELPQAVWVLGGREKLRWEELHPSEEWKGQIEQHLIGDLSETDARLFLTSCKIKQPDIVQRIITSYVGLPFFLDLMVDIYQEVAQSRNPEPKDFPERHEEVYERFLRHITQAEADTFKILSCLQNWDSELLEALLKEFNQAYHSPSALQQVTRFSFVAPNQTGDGFSMHQLMQDHFYDQYTQEDPEQVQRIHAFMFTYLEQQLEATEEVEERKTLIIRIIYHALVVKQANELYEWITKQTDAIDIAMHSFFYLEVHESIRQKLEGYSFALANSLLIIGAALIARGNYYDAELSIREAVSISKKDLGKEHPTLALALNLLAGLFVQQGKYEEAAPLIYQAISIIRKVSGEEHPMLAQALNNLAGLFVQQGKYEEAEPIIRQAMSISEKAMEVGDINAILIRNTLAEVLAQQGKYEEAEPIIRQAISTSEKVLGSEHVAIAKLLISLALLLSNQARYKEAEPLLQQAILINEKVLGSEHPTTIVAQNIQTSIFVQQGRYKEAEPFLQQGVSISEKVLGNEHPQTILAINNLSNLLREQGRYKEAEPLLRKVVATNEKVLGSEHPNAILGMSNLSVLLYNQGNYEEAESLFRKVVAINKKVLGSEHPQTILSVNNLANLLREQGSYEEAEPLLLQAVELNERVLGSEHPVLAQALNNLAELLKDQGRYEKAEPLYRQALSICQKVLGASHPRTGLLLNNLATMLQSSGKHKKAESLFQKSYKICHSSLGEHHPTSKLIYRNWQALLRKMNK